MEIKCCENHIGHAIDVFLEKEKDFPILNKLEESEQLSTSCAYCEAPAEYVVGNK